MQDLYHQQYPPGPSGILECPYMPALGALGSGYNAAISCCEKGGKWQLALYFFESMQNARLDQSIISYNVAWLC